MCRRCQLPVASYVPATRTRGASYPLPATASYPLPATRCHPPVASRLTRAVEPSSHAPGEVRVSIYILTPAYLRCQLPVVSYPRPATRGQLPEASYPRPATRGQLPEVPAARCQLLPATRCQLLPATRCQLPVAIPP